MTWRAAPSRLPLRIKLVAALTALVALALGVSGVGAAQALRGYLMDRVDANLTQALRAPGRGPGRPGPVGPLDGEVGRPRRSGDYVLLVARPDGTVVRDFDLGPDGGPPPQLPALTPTYVSRRANRPFTVQAVEGEQRWRVLVRPLAGGGTVALAASLSEVRSTVARLLQLELFIGLIVLLLLAGIAYVVVRSSLRPLVAVEATAQAIADGDLSRRVADGDPRTEVGRLSRSLNAMLSQIEGAFRAQSTSEAAARQSEERMRRFVADASHELRTPLTSIRGFAELYRQGAVPVGRDLDRVMRRVEDEATRMGLLVEDLLLLARLDQQRPLLREPVDLLALARDAVHDAAATAPDRTLTVRTAGTPPIVIGDEGRLRQVFANLVSNALTHTPPGTAVRVTVGTRDAAALVEVTDDGPGLTTEQAARAFERFYRADASRTRTQGGSGLGLSIVAALVAAHGGRVEVDSAPGAGATFRVLLPTQVS